jgi:hypothetical protein
MFGLRSGSRRISEAAGTPTALLPVSSCTYPSRPSFPYPTPPPARPPSYQHIAGTVEFTPAELPVQRDSWKRTEMHVPVWGDLPHAAHTCSYACFARCELGASDC